MKLTQRGSRVIISTDTSLAGLVCKLPDGSPVPLLPTFSPSCYQYRNVVMLPAGTDQVNMVARARSHAAHITIHRWDAKEDQKTVKLMKMLRDGGHSKVKKPIVRPKTPEERAVIRLQASHRGIMSRLRTVPALIQRGSALRHIQKTARDDALPNIRARNNLRGLAATVIQSRVRGLAARKEITQMGKAATSIQAKHRGNLNRAEVRGKDRRSAVQRGFTQFTAFSSAWAVHGGHHGRAHGGGAKSKREKSTDAIPSLEQLQLAAGFRQSGSACREGTLVTARPRSPKEGERPSSPQEGAAGSPGFARESSCAGSDSGGGTTRMRGLHDLKHMAHMVALVDTVADRRIQIMLGSAGSASMRMRMCMCMRVGLCMRVRLRLRVRVCIVLSRLVSRPPSPLHGPPRAAQAGLAFNRWSTPLQRLTADRAGSRRGIR